MRGDLLSACRVLFAPRAEFDQVFLDGLDVATVRRGFRSRAMEVHPDRAAALGRSPAVLAKAFGQVEAAYRLLCEHLNPCPQSKDTTPATPPAHPAPQPRRECPTPPPDHFWSGHVPPRTLRFGEYLYYSGRIPWMQLIHALVWQTRQHTRFGQIAASLGYLTAESIAKSLSQRRPTEKIGEAALRLRLLSVLQQQAVLHAQTRGRRRIGDYFLESGILAADELAQFEHGFRSHNARVALAR